MARRLPTVAGWWWYHDPSSPHAVCIYVGQSPIDGRMILETTGGIVDTDEVDGDWLAPIPSPAICAALADYSAAVMQRGPMQARGVSISGALLALDDAIRAEREVTA